MSRDFGSLPAQPIQWLVVHALNELHSASEDPEVGGCCHRCCGPCGALKEFLDLGLLEQLVHPAWKKGWWTDHETGIRQWATVWWDPERQEVDRAWLRAALNGLAVEHQHEDEME